MKHRAKAHSPYNTEVMIYPQNNCQFQDHTTTKENQSTATHLEQAKKLRNERT